MNTSFKLAGLAAAALLAAAPAFADTTNGPDPYAAGFGFDTPQEAAWSDWTRGAGDTLYAEWDSFFDASYAGTRTAAADVGSHGATDVYAGWNAGTFTAGSGNLYSFTVDEAFTFNLTDSSPISGPVRAVMQTEGWGNDIYVGSVLLNGVAPTVSTITYQDPAYDTSMGPVTLTQRLFSWDLANAPTNYAFNFSGQVHMALAQVAVDVGQVTAVPEPETYAMLLAGLGVMGAIARRRRQA